ncbi:hypothetical protein LOZ61_000709 [Ophidiomyces ophidiicola]|uniref:Uncharacterized protein n=1 Tax=Ophidiomyces ophidiicola TaxID=1387563 RepID=A0ACB8UUR3_9EURO|nr:uncharacterized protein LOZ57_003766 [Ophidiomyces ophidiicola]KAI1917192.1 hypothetical protein LOZ61_000709 [Ophidiomyces ophidiicola]KAI1929687.1 hypothetical protein LOZ60_001434 [Ophidiomyces ophidiicola]KAI1946511.1 hypothetical protein LOZ57_003766 [Ophidiomyces ophidiicola]KAI1960441.1 hypothetical protein LOZ59_002690 [Ophidiomyces ophidiicola]KAI1971726.1 hypothetical protein LOZ56_002858 [Ophidiomyces ophidiicola]
MSSMQQRRDEILAKKAKLAELKRQREMRQREFSQTRMSIGEASEILSPTPGRSDNRAELDSLISRLVDRPSSAARKEGGEASPRGRGSRPNSVLSGGQLSGDNAETYTPPVRPLSQSIATQTTLSPTDPQAQPQPLLALKTEILTYNKAVQTDAWTDTKAYSGDESGSDNDGSPVRMSRRAHERDEVIRKQLRKEIEDEIAASIVSEKDIDSQQAGHPRYPLRTLTNEELNAVTSSGEFLDFVERSSKVIERALDEEYDVLADYALGGLGAEDDEDDDFRVGKKRREIKQVAQFWDERWSKKRMITDISFSPKASALKLSISIQ